MIKKTSIEHQELKTKTAFEFGENTPYVVRKAAEEAMYATLATQQGIGNKSIPASIMIKLTKLFIEEFDNRLNDVELMYDIRYCSECGVLMRSGYLIGGGDEYYCSDECLHKHFSRAEYLALYAGLDHTDESVLEQVLKMSEEELDKLSDDNDSDTFWTDWK